MSFQCLRKSRSDPHLLSTTLPQNPINWIHVWKSYQVLQGVHDIPGINALNIHSSQQLSAEILPMRRKASPVRERELEQPKVEASWWLGKSSRWIRWCKPPIRICLMTLLPNQQRGERCIIYFQGIKSLFVRIRVWLPVVQIVSLCFVWGQVPSWCWPGGRDWHFADAAGQPVTWEIGTKALIALRRVANLI